MKWPLTVILPRRYAASFFFFRYEMCGNKDFFFILGLPIRLNIDLSKKNTLK